MTVSHMKFAAEFANAFVPTRGYKENSKRTKHIMFGMSFCEDNGCKLNIEVPVVVQRLRYGD
jgi:hypothetical protein